MGMQDQQAKIEWRDGRVPVSTQFDDPYFSLEDGVAETEHVFLKGNDLPVRFENGFHIAELGFGTGLNFLVAWQAWEAKGAIGRLHFTSFEAFPMVPGDRAQALRAFPSLAPYAERWADGLSRTDPLLTVIEGDARETLTGWDGAADAWFLDGFSPAKNPELWEPPLMQAVGDHTKRGGTFATYTAAGNVRRALQTAGFEVERIQGFGRKRHMSRGRKV